MKAAADQPMLAQAGYAKIKKSHKNAYRTFSGDNAWSPIMWHRPLVFLLLLAGVLCGIPACVPPPRALPPPPSEDLMQAQAQEDCRFYRLSPVLPRDGEETCIKSRMEAIQNITAMRSDPYFAQAQQACVFFRGSPTEDTCYRTRIREYRAGGVYPLP